MWKFVTVALIVILSQGCSKSEINRGCCSVPLSIVPTINPEEATVAHLDDYIGSLNIGVQVTNFIGTVLYYPDTKNIELSKSETWNLSKTVCISCLKAKIYAYSPFSAIESDLTGTGETAQILLNIPGNQEMRDQVDYLYASQDKHLPVGGSDIININPDVTLRLNHALALVSFVIYKDNYSGAGVLTQFEIKNTVSTNLRINKSGGNDLKMSLSDGTITGGENTASIFISSVDNIITETKDPGTNEETLKAKINGYAYVIPASFAHKEDMQFVFMIDNQAVTVSLTGVDVLEWEKGKQYIYN